MTEKQTTKPNPRWDHIIPQRRTEIAREIYGLREQIEALEQEDARLEQEMQELMP